MSTVGKDLAEEIIKKDGYYHPEDPRVLYVLSYDNQFGGKSWAICYTKSNYEGYLTSPAVANVKVLWQAG